MKSPMKSKEMILTKECRLFDFRKEEFEIIFIIMTVRIAGSNLLPQA